MPQRILILDDDPDVARVISLIAEGLGFETRTTDQADAFFALVSDWQPTHLAIDLIMPDMDGVEVLAALAAHRCTSQIIITSGVGARVLDAARRSADAHGLAISGTLPKPFRPDTLRRLLRAPHAAPRPTDPAIPGAATPALGTEDLLTALDDDQLCVVFQPKIACETGALRGFEALVRWDHPTFGRVMPDAFIPMAEEGGLIGLLTDRVLELALSWLGRLDAPERLSMAVNLSGREIGDYAFADRLEASCRRHGLRPDQVILELTESSAMADPVRGLELMTRLRVKGFQLAIDDFGTGYSSMVQLARLPFSELKIDRSFVATVGASAESRTIVRSMVDLAHGLGLQAVGEGVEDAECLAFLLQCGCDLAQGYHIARPLAAEDAVAWVAARSVSARKAMAARL